LGFIRSPPYPICYLEYFVPLICNAIVLQLIIMKNPLKYKTKFVYSVEDKSDVKASFGFTSLKQVADLLDVNESTVWRNLRNGFIDSEKYHIIKIGVIPDGRKDNGDSERWNNPHAS